MATDPITGLVQSTSSYYDEIQAQAAAQRAANKKDETLGMKDFIQLLVAQLQNQDMMNPMDNTQFIEQMATFSNLTAITSLVEQNNTSYAVSLVGKEVTAAVVNEETGMLETTTGVVTGISLFDGTPKLFIGDKQFELQNLMAIGKIPEKAEEDPGAADGTGGTEGSGGTDGTDNGGETEDNTEVSGG